jgi:hypothetical protein
MVSPLTAEDVSAVGIGVSDSDTRPERSVTL